MVEEEGLGRDLSRVINLRTALCRAGKGGSIEGKKSHTTEISVRDLTQFTSVHIPS